MAGISFQSMRSSLGLQDALDRRPQEQADDLAHVLDEDVELGALAPGLADQGSTRKGRPRA